MNHYQIISDITDSGVKFKKGELFPGEKNGPVLVTISLKTGKKHTLNSKLVKEIIGQPTIINTKVKKWLPYNKDVAGRAAVSKNITATVYAFDKKGNFIKLYSTATPNLNHGIGSGRGVEMTNGLTVWLITLKTPYDGSGFGYVSYQDVYFSAVRVEDEAKAKKDAQALLNGLEANDKKLLAQMNAFGFTIDQAKAKGIDVTAQQAKLKEMAESFVRRQQNLKTNPFIKITQVANLHGIGVIPILVGVAVGAGMVLAGLVVYYFLKPEYNTSQLHSKYITDNEAELKAKLGPEAYAELKKNVDKEIKAEAANAYSEGKGEGIWSILKPIGFGLLGFYLVTKLQKGSSPRKATA